MIKLRTPDGTGFPAFPGKNLFTTRLIFVLSWFALPIFGYAQEGQFPPPVEPPVIRATKATGEIAVDGRLTEPDWERAPAITDFFRQEPRQGGAYNYQTEVRILFDDKNLYVGMFAADSLGRKGVRVQDLRRDFLWGENDILGIQLDPQNLRQYCVSFQTTPYGNQRDLQNFNDTNTDNDWNALWSVRTDRTDTGYYAEFAIPFKSIRYTQPPPGVPPTWGLTLMRLARREYEQTVFPAIPQSFSPYRMTYAARLEGLELPAPSANVRIEPYALYQYDDVKVGDAATARNDAKLGGDVKWAINPRSVLDLTINTDFAQADVDRAVNNLERFNIFFPERRQFFLENSGIWAGADNTAVVPFFSRRIGLEGDFNAEPAPIHAGARYTMRDDKQAIAGLYVHQAETDRTPAASFAVGRYLRNYGSENNVGLMATYRLNEPSDELGARQNDNATLTVDGLIRPKSELTVTYMLSGSRDNTSDTMGVAGKVFAGYNTNKFYLGWLTNVVSQDYRPDMGFVFQRNVIQHNPGGYYIIRPKGLPWIRRFDPGAFVNYYHDANQPGNFQQANIYLFPIFLIFTDGSFFEYSISPTWQNIDFDFAPLGLGIARSDYYYTRQRVRYNTDRSRKLSVSTQVDWGGFYNGKRLTINGGVRYAPIPQAAISVDHEYNNLQGVGALSEDLATNLTTVGARFALNPRVQLSALYQYNTFDKQGRWNVRGTWEYRPLSFVYLVYNGNRIDQLDDPLREQQFIGKVTLVNQF